jgi:2-polyprenyl-6-methoxyphenol hydroxylase-like FAD-dependent oxidoreductase
MSTQAYDVAIVGYGPTGMTLAGLLGQAGHRVIVFERYAGLYNLPRAACFDDEIMRTFQKLGLTDEVSPGTVVQRDYDWVNADGETLVEISYDEQAPGGWPQLFMMYQPHIETVLDRFCKSLETVEVRQETAVTGFEEDDEGVVVRAAVGEGGDPVEVRARYLVGADGGSGIVRPSLGIGSDDYAFEENWLVCDFERTGSLDRVPTFRQVCDPAQPIAIVRIGPEHQRFSFMLDADEDPKRAVDPERVWAHVAEYLTPADANLIRVANYVFRSRIAETWRRGRVLLAGDAAHEMPPFLAQGMCSGMRDAHNLAWKLDLILDGRADDLILDSYQAEREPHVRFITEKAIELGRVQTLRDPELARERDERLLALRRQNQEPERLRYPALADGPLTGDLGGDRPGEFFPQGRVRLGGVEGRFDDVVGAGPCIVATGDAAAALDPARRERWRRLGGRLALVVAPGCRNGSGGEGVEEVEDLDGTYGRWFEQSGAAAAVVRPDWYLFGAAADGTGLVSLLDAIEAALGTAERPSAG